MCMFKLEPSLGKTLGCIAGKAVLPSFDHAYGDPVEEDVQILPETKVVIIEGNYMLLGELPSSLY